MKIPFTDINKVYVTSDTHYGHVNLTRGVTSWDESRTASADGNVLKVRDFDTVEEMSAAIVDGINSMVPQDAILIHDGDWSFGGKANIGIFRNKLNVRQLHLITGNHDRHIAEGGFDHLFTTRNSELKLTIGSLLFHFYHHPIQSWDGMGKDSFHLHGHQHWIGNSRFGNGRKMDIGTDGNGFKPYKLTDVIDMLKDRVRFPEKNDHHDL